MSLDPDAYSPLRPVVRRSLADEVRDQLHERIRSGELAPGAPLPPETVLSEQFRVSRTSVREAIRDLITLGAVERRGKRAHVVERLPGVALDEVQRRERIREVFETRRLLEVQLTEYAAERATVLQRDEVAELAARLDAVTSTAELRSLDRAFHGLIASAAGNALLAELHAKVLDATFESPAHVELLRDVDDAAMTAAILAASTRSHIAIARAVAAGDARAAGDAARAHLDDVWQRLALT